MKGTVFFMSNRQLAPAAAGDTVAVMHTSLGDITIRLFPADAPKAVENFTTHAKNGYYNGVKFHRVISDFMIQGGDPQGTGMGGESIWGRPFEDEFTPELHNYRGALCMANAGPNTNGSQFFIVQASSVPGDMLAQMKALTDRGFPQECIDNYAKLGGTPWLDFKHTVFGQVTAGMDVVDAIAAAPVDGRDMPVTDIVIQGVDVTEL